MLRAIFPLWALAVLLQTVPAASAEWVVAQDPHFLFYSQAGAESAGRGLARFEEIRFFFAHTRLLPAGTSTDERPAVRVVEFASKAEFDAIKPRPIADAYYTGEADGDTVVTTLATRSDLAIAAHEYTHLVLHARHLRLPPWFSEGVAEYFSTLRRESGNYSVGGPIPSRMQTLQHQPWLPVQDLLTQGLDTPAYQSRSGAALFYAESWAVADMLISSSEYAPRFDELLRILGSGTVTSQQGLAQVYHQSPEQVYADAQSWVKHNRSSRRIFPIAAESTPFQPVVSSLSFFQTQMLTANLLLTDGALDRAHQAFENLLRQAPDNPELMASLGLVALRQKDAEHAAALWSKALDAGLHDGALCYRYALLAEELQRSPAEVQRALERAVAADAHLDDARYRLALLRMNAGDYRDAAAQLQAMAAPPAERAYNYWSALSYTLAELGQRTDAEEAARRALAAARTTDEQARAASLGYVARTDLTVRFARAADGTLQLVTTRVPHGSTDFNPFIEPDDRLASVSGQLREVQCRDGKLTGFVVDSGGASLTLAVPDPLHVLMRHAPAEFFCGPQEPRPVKAEYAAGAKPDSGLLRGMDFP